MMPSALLKPKTSHEFRQVKMSADGESTVAKDKWMKSGCGLLHQLDGRQ